MRQVRGRRLTSAEPARLADVTDCNVLAPSTVDPLLAELLSQGDLQQWALLRRQDDTAVVAAVAGEGLEWSLGDRIPWEDTICSRMVAGEGPRAVGDLATVPAYAQAAVAKRLALRSYVGVPIHCGGSVAGTLCGLSQTTTTESGPDAVLLLEAYAKLIGRLWEAESEARTDALTGLMNRRGWGEILTREDSRCRRHGLEAAVLAVDLDDFKGVNDREGHAAGDRYLKRAAGALAQSVRGHEVLARWGGDEFLVLTVDTSPEQALGVTRRLEAALSAVETPGTCAAATCRQGGLECAAERALQAVGQLKRGKRAQALFDAPDSGNIMGDEM